MWHKHSLSLSLFLSFYFDKGLSIIQFFWKLTFQHLSKWNWKVQRIISEQRNFWRSAEMYQPFPPLSISLICLHVLLLSPQVNEERCEICHISNFVIHSDEHECRETKTSTLLRDNLEDITTFRWVTFQL